MIGSDNCTVKEKLTSLDTVAGLYRRQPCRIFMHALIVHGPRLTPADQ